MAGAFCLEVTAKKQVTLGSIPPALWSSIPLTVQSEEWLAELNKMPPSKNLKFHIFKSKDGYKNHQLKSC